MTTVGFIGLGVMGRPMAMNLVRGGFDVVGHNRSSAAVDAVVAAGGRSGASIADVVGEADVVITMLPDSPDVESVVLGEAGVLANARPGQLYIDMSTIDPTVSSAIAGRARQIGVKPLDAPVSGGERGAIDAALSIMVGGRAEDFDSARLVFDSLGTTVVHVGPDGAGQTVKAANQLIVAGIIELVAEAITLLRAQDVDLEPALRVLAGGLAGNRVLELKGASMAAGDYRPGFRVDLHHKDLGIAMQAARSAGLSLPVSGLVAQLMAALRARGHGDLDHSALLLLVQDLCGAQRPD